MGLDTEPTVPSFVIRDAATEDFDQASSVMLDAYQEYKPDPLPPRGRIRGKRICVRSARLAHVRTRRSSSWRPSATTSSERSPSTPRHQTRTSSTGRPNGPSSDSWPSRQTAGARGSAGPSLKNACDGLNGKERELSASTRTHGCLTRSGCTPSWGFAERPDSTINPFSTRTSRLWDGPRNSLQHPANPTDLAARLQRSGVNADRQAMVD